MLETEIVKWDNKPECEYTLLDSDTGDEEMKELMKEYRNESVNNEEIERRDIDIEHE